MTDLDANGLASPGTGAEAPPPLAAPGSHSRRLIFWALVLGSVVLIAAGVWQLVQTRQAAAAAAAHSIVAVTVAPAADFRLATADGSMLRLSDLRGQVVLLNFWATWCPPCRAEMPDLQALQEEYAGARKFTVVAVDVEESQKQVANYARLNGITFPLLLDADGQVSERIYAVRTLPTSIIIDRDGQIRDKWVGQLSKGTVASRLARVW